VIFLVATLLGLAFGAGDQFLGSRSISLGLWASTAAQMSAPWVILPFVLGVTQLNARRAALLGLVVTVSALFGYFAMTYSPIEIHPWSVERFTTGMVAITIRERYNALYILGGLVTGPLFGLLGQRWRVRRSWVSAALVAGALCLEPLARWAVGQLMPPAHVWGVEVASGAVLAAAFAYALIAWQRTSRVSSELS
jgi:hypothetical protein